MVASTKTSERKPRSAKKSTLAMDSSPSGFDFQGYNTAFLNRPTEAPLNDAESYGVTVNPAKRKAGVPYWKVVGIHHLTPAENRSRHNVFIDVLDENGNRIHDPKLRAGWTWEGKNDGPPDPKQLDKPDNEPIADIPLEKDMTVSVWLQGDGASDQVVGLHTRHPDERTPDGEIFNSFGHHSYYVVFQRTTPAKAKPKPKPAVALASSAPAATPVAADTPVDESKPAFYPDYIYGIHEAGGEQLMRDAGRPGWVLELAEVGLSGMDGNADFRGLARGGIGVVVRINHGYGSTGTLPLPDQYHAFAEACGRFVARSNGCHVWIIGNEPNHADERPQGKFITPSNYAQAYSKCRTHIHSLTGHESDQVLVAGPAPWNAQTRYPGNDRGDWAKYLADTLALLPDDGCDGVAIHTYTHDLNVDQITGDFFQGDASYKDLRSEFRTYRDFMGAIPPRFRSLPVLITETDPTDPNNGWRDGRNIGWVQAAYNEIANWNADPSNQPIQALILYRWPPGQVTNQPVWSISDRPGIIEDFKQAMQMQPADRYRVRMASAQPQPDDGPQAPIPAIFTNQQLINAFYYASQSLGGDYTALLAQAGLDVNTLAADRNKIYDGPTIAQLPNLTRSQAQAIRREMIGELLQSVCWVGVVNAALGGNLRTAPDTNATVLVTLPSDTTVQVLGELNAWLFVAAGDRVGCVAAELVTRRSVGGVPGSTGAEVALAPAIADRIDLPAGSGPDAQLVGGIWNTYGGFLQSEAQRLSVDVDATVGVLAAESAGEPFGPDGRLVIRFENHIFYQYWGVNNPARFAQHFSFAPNTQWQDHRWRPDPSGPWQSFHGDQGAEWQVFNFARGLDDRAATLSISMGAPQMMGFNYDMLGYVTPQAMLAAFSTDVRAQLRGMFRYLEARSLIDALRQRNLTVVAAGYNGPGQAEAYGALLQRYADAFNQLRQPAGALAPAAAPQPLTVPPTMIADATPLPVSSDPTRPLIVADPELYAAWRRHVEQGFRNNEIMFQQILTAFVNPYWSTVWMYRILFGVGIVAFVAALIAAFWQYNISATLIFGGLSVASFLAFFIRRPLQALEENLQFITWLGIVYNTYWTRLVQAQNPDTFAAELDKATDDAIKRINDLVDKHAASSGQRPGNME